MTKFQIVLTYIKKYIFWVITGLCLVVTFIVGASVTGSKQAEFKAKVAEIDNHFSDIQRLAGQEVPNEMVVDQKKKDVLTLKETIIDAWYQLYNPQVQYFENLWPNFRNAKGDVDAQAADYLDELQKTWRSQTVFDAADNMPSEVQDAYRQYVTQIQEFDFMTRYKIYVPQTGVDGMDGAGMINGIINNQVQETTGTTGVELPSEGMCTWDDVNRQQMRRRFRIMSRRIGNGKPNSTRKVLLVQEDIWMYDILLGAISKMNEKSEGSHDAVVKRIFRIDIADDASTLNSTGEDASQRGSGRASARENRGFDEKNKNVVFNAEERVVSVAEPQRTGNEELGEGDIPTEIVEEEEGSSGMADSEFEEIFDYRYCDAYGNFMSSVDLAAYLKTKPEYIMMPVHIKILINQKKIPQFLLNCLNSEIPIYIHQISMKARDIDSIRHHLEIVPDEDDVTAENGEGLGGSSRQMRRSSREDRGNDLEDNSDQELLNDSMLDRTNENGEIDRRKPEDVEFEMWGMICIFNKPDESKFESVLGEASSEGEEDEESTDDEESADSEENADDEDTADEDEADEEAAEMNSNEEETPENAAEPAEEETEEAPAKDADGSESEDAGENADEN
ncbi:MAG: hypothetical protein IJQ31_11880 [Thermoguttaceae bacterium]|nr:hypothetical protein [Thermoguttaceae bacterium]